MNDEQATEPTVLPSPHPDLTPRQRVVAYLARNLSNDLQTGTVAEQHTAALLALVADAVTRGYEAGLVELVRKWQLTESEQPELRA